MGDKSPQKEHAEQKAGPRSGKGFTYEVVLLDGEHVNIELDKNADGKDLFEKVCLHLDLIEREYFGLQYVDERIPHPLKCWLSPDKKIAKQKKRGPWLFDFALKFYPPDPTQLRESLTRWLVTLQCRRDILAGKLPATFLTQAMLGSYCVQADVGDYDSMEHHGIDYIKDMSFAANQTTELLEKIAELHRQHKGQTPDESEANYLENVKKLSMYGVDLHAAQDVNGVDIMVGVCASGLQVYREKLRISRFVWPKILKISYKRNHFYIKVRPQDSSRQESSVSFKLASHRLAKRLWKICVEHHAFFRLREADQPNNAAMFPRLGSKFRYSGRTLYQARHSSQNLDRPDPYFERSQPARNTYAAPSNRSRSVDELTSRPDSWKDDLEAEVRRRPTEGRDRRDHIGQPTVLSILGLPAGMKPVESEEGRQLVPGSDVNSDGRDRHHIKPGEEDSTVERANRGGTTGLQPSEVQMAAREEEKERKKREKEEEKRKRKEEEEKKKAEKAAKKGKGRGSGDPTAEDRADHMGGGDATEWAPGRPVGDSYCHWEGLQLDSGPEVERRQHSALDADGDGKDRFSTFKDPAVTERWSFNMKHPDSGSENRVPGKEGRSPGPHADDRDDFFSGREPHSPGSDKREPYLPREDGRQLYFPGRAGKEPYSRKDGREPFFLEKDEREPYSGRDGREPYSGRDGREPYSGGDRREARREDPGLYVLSGEREDTDPGLSSVGERRPADRGVERGVPPGQQEEDRWYFAPGDNPRQEVRQQWSLVGAPLELGRVQAHPEDLRHSENDNPIHTINMKGGKEADREEDKDQKRKKDGKDANKVDEEEDKKKKKRHKDLDKDDDKDPKRKKKGRKDSDKEDDKDPKKKKDHKDSDKDDKEGKKDKKKGKKEKEKKGVNKEEAGKAEDEDRHPPGNDVDSKGAKGDKPDRDKKGGLLAKLKKPKDCKDRLPEEDQASRLHRPPPLQAHGLHSPGWGPGVGVGGGDMSGVMGDETWIDNKMTFHPVLPPKKESRDSLKRLGDKRLSDIDHTMPFFSPAATSTVGRPRSKVPPPVSPKPNSSFSFDDSFSRRDPPVVATESVQYHPDLEERPVSTTNVPVVQTETRTVTYEREGFPWDSQEDGVLVSARSHSTRMQTIETTTYKTEKDGVQETRVEHKVVLSSTDDDFDYDAALAEAIRSVTEFNPDMSVERIECVQQIEEVRDQ